MYVRMDDDYMEGDGRTKEMGKFDADARANGEFASLLEYYLTRLFPVFVRALVSANFMRYSGSRRLFCCFARE